MISYIQAFKKPFLLIKVAAVLGILYFGCATVISSVSVWAERDLGAFPFKQEDWLRYLLPAMFDRPEQHKILLTGPSTVRENLIYEEFVAAFPGYIIEQGGISSGTIEDVNLSLEYIEQAYGHNALPSVIVIGVAPRFIANIPDDRPFKDGINDYSPHLKIIRTDNGDRLESKSVFESLLARVKFFLYKKPSQLQTDALAVVNYWLSRKTIDNTREDLPAPKTPLLNRCDQFFKKPSVKQIMTGTPFYWLADFEFSEVLAEKISPYKYRLFHPIQADKLITRANNKSSWWPRVYSWNPKEHEAQTLKKLKRFIGFINSHNIRLLVVNMPERDLSRAMFNEDNYREYIALLESAFQNKPFINMRDALPPSDFHDLEHARYSGASRLSREVIKHLREVLSAKSSEQISAI